MLKFFIFSFLLFGEHYCDQIGFMGTVLKISEDTVIGQIDFETIQDDWILKNMKIIDTDDGFDNVDDIPGKGHVAVPHVSMSGDEWGSVYATFQIPSFSRVEVEFMVFVSGFDPEAESGFLVTNPDLIISLVDVKTSRTKKLTNLDRLNPKNKIWNRYRTEVQTGDADGEYRISLDTTRGGGVLALDAVKVEIIPVVEAGEVGRGNITEIEEGPTQVNPDVRDNATQTSNSSTNLENNVTPETNKSENLENKTTLENITKPNNNDDSEPSNISESKTTDSTESSTTASNRTNSKSNITSDNLSSLNSGDTSMYGYTGEVILICLAIIFILLFLGIVYKYYRLKSHMGDYSLDQGSSRQNSQDNQGHDVQMSYRMDD